MKHIGFFEGTKEVGICFPQEKNMEKIRSRAHKKEHDYIYDDFFEQRSLFIHGHYFFDDQVDGQKYGNQGKGVL